MTRLRSLRVVVIAILALLALQFELGMAVNLSPSLEVAAPLAGTPAAIWGALATVGGAAVTHALLGIFLTLVTLASLVFAVLSGAKSVAVIGILSFIAMALASSNGVLFTLSGFRNDGYSHGMSTMFLVVYSLNFIQVCVLTVKLRRQAVA